MRLHLSAPGEANYGEDNEKVKLIYRGKEAVVKITKSS